MPLSSSNAVRQLSDGTAPGNVFGQSPSDLIRFYGAFNNSSGVSQVNVIGSTLVGSVASTLAVNATSGGAGTTWAFASSTQANMVISTMIWLWNLGLIG